MLRAANPKHGFVATFEAEGVSVRTPDGASAFSFSGAAYGCPGDTAPLPAATPVLVGERVEYRRGEVVESYTNDSRGLEQTFLLPRPPPCRLDEQTGIVVEFAVGGAADVVVDRGKSAATVAVLRSSDGHANRSYSDLHVIDARGDELPASLSTRGGTMTIEIDDARAVYPLRVDPLISKFIVCDLAATEDTYIAFDPTDPTLDVNYGSAAVLKAGVNGTKSYETLLKFPLGLLSNNVTVDAAQLVMTRTASGSSPSGTFDVYPILTPWAEAQGEDPPGARFDRADGRGPAV